MTDKLTPEVIEGNKLIVLFMGGKFADTIRSGGHDYEMFDLPASFPIKLSTPDEFGMKRTGYLGFHSRWDWLKPAIDKIHTYCIAYPDQARKVTQMKIVVHIKPAWEQVVDFIKFLNTQTKSK